MRTMNKGTKATFFALHFVLWVGVLARSVCRKFPLRKTMAILSCDR